MDFRSVLVTERKHPTCSYPSLPVAFFFPFRSLFWILAFWTPFGGRPLRGRSRALGVGASTRAAARQGFRRGVCRLIRCSFYKGFIVLSGCYVGMRRWASGFGVFSLSRKEVEGRAWGIRALRAFSGLRRTVRSLMQGLRDLYLMLNESCSTRQACHQAWKKLRANRTEATLFSSFDVWFRGRG